MGRAAWLAGLAVSLLPWGAHAQGTLSALQHDVDQIASRARPCVVTVLAQRTVTHRDLNTGQPVRRPHTRVGSGVAVEESGVLTTASVVLGAERVVVRTLNGLQVEARIAGMDPIFNIAYLTVPDLKLPVLRFADRPAELGDWVVALGTSYRSQPTQSVGQISRRHSEPRTSLLEITNAVYPGNSGGAALNTRGELVGLVLGELGTPDLGTGGRDSERRPTGMSFVMPVEDVRPVFEAIKRDGRVRYGYLGVSTRAEVVESETERGLRVPLGAKVESVLAGSPADLAGLKRGDLIVAFDQGRIEYPEQLARWVAETRPGTPVQLVWARNGLAKSGRVRLGESPVEVPQWVATAPPAPVAAPAAPAPQATRIAELEKQIKALSQELDRLKTQGPGDH